MERTCNKIPYPSKSCAKKKARQLRNKRYGTDLKAYHCQICGKYHLTSKTDMNYIRKCRNNFAPSVHEMFQGVTQ